MALTLGILFIGVNKIADGLNPLIVGALIVAIGLSLGGPTGYAINPARDLGLVLHMLFYLSQVKVIPNLVIRYCACIGQLLVVCWALWFTKCL